MLRLDIVVTIILAYPAQLIDAEKIPSQTLLTVVRRTDVTLICRHPSSKYCDQEVTWFFSPMVGPSFRPISDDGRFKRNAENNSLLIQNVTIEDAGMYFCCFDGPCMDTYLVVLEFENILSFASDVDDAAGEIIVSSKGDFTITAHHGSEVKVEIVKEPDIPICDYLIGNVVCYKRRRTDSTSYYIKNAHLQNSGRFFIHSSFMKLNGGYPLSVVIKGKPVINLESVQIDDGFNFVCGGYAYPPPVFDFHFIPSENADSVSSMILQTVVNSKHSTNVSATARIMQPMFGAGTVQCTASNSEGISYDSLFIGNFNGQNYLEMPEKQNLKLEITFSVTSANQSIIVGDAVHLQCKAHFFSITNSFIFQYSGTNYSEYAVLQEDDWVASLTIIASREELVACYVELKNGSRLSEQIRLPLELKINDALENDNSILQNLSYFISFISLICLLVYMPILVYRKLCSKLSSETELIKIITIDEE